MGLNGSPTNSNPYQLQPVYTHANTYFSLPLRYRWIGLFRGACALEITSCSYQAAFGYPRVISIKLYGRGWKISVEMQIPSGRFQRNEWGWGNGRAANGVGPAPGENFGSGGENYRKTNPSVRYLYEVRENFNHVCMCVVRVSWIRKRDAWPIRRENFLGGHGCSTSLPTWERISPRSCSMHAPNLNMLHACVTGASLHDERGQYRSADIPAV